MQVFYLVQTVFFALAFVSGVLVCDAEAANLLPESDCCPSSQDESPASPEPETICCQLGQGRFLSTEEKIDITVETRDLTPETLVIRFVRVVAPVRLILSGPFPEDLHFDHSLDSDHLRNTRTPRAPC